MDAKPVTVVFSDGRTEERSVRHHLNLFYLHGNGKNFTKLKFADLSVIPEIGNDGEQVELTFNNGDRWKLIFREAEDARRFVQQCAKAKGTRGTGNRPVASMEVQRAPAATLAPATSASSSSRRRSFGGGMDFFEFTGSNNSLPQAVATPESQPEKKRKAIDERCGELPRGTPEKSRPLAQAPVMRRAPPRGGGLLTITPSTKPTQPQQSSWYRGYRSTETFGLRNLGNTCYLNAVMQAVCSLREFVGDLRLMPKALPTCSQGDLFSTTVEILGQMSSNDHSRGPLNPAKLREAVARACPMFAGGGQQDAHEFFLEFVNQLHDELLEARDTWLRTQDSPSTSGEEETVPATQNYFDSEVEKRLTCTKCGHTREVFERFRDFSLDFSSGTDGALGSMLETYFRQELLDVKCEQCGDDVANLDKTLTSMPRVLVLHLKRFVPNLEQRRYDKQHQSVGGLSRLNLRSCLGMAADGAAAGGGDAGAVPRRLPARPLAGFGEESQADAAGEGIYSLRSVVAHDGVSPHSGHYVCYARGERGGWRLYDDSIARDLPESFQPDKQLGSKAYILFYVREGGARPTPAA